MTNIDTLRALTDYINEEMGHDGDIDLDMDLLESRILDSFSIVQMAMFIQDRFDIELETDDMVRENLSTLTNIMALIESRKSA